MTKVDVSRVCERLSELIEEAMAGNEVLITQEERPLVRLVPAPEIPRKRRTFGSAKGLIKIADDFDEPLEDFREYV
jgi:prevent-host-death family protein